MIDAGRRCRCWQDSSTNNAARQHNGMVISLRMGSTISCCAAKDLFEAQWSLDIEGAGYKHDPINSSLYEFEMWKLTAWRSWANFQRKTRTLLAVSFVCFLTIDFCQESKLKSETSRQHLSTLYCSLLSSEPHWEQCCRVSLPKPLTKGTLEKSWVLQARFWAVEPTPRLQLVDRDKATERKSTQILNT